MKVNNKIGSYLFNKFDFLIRFIYCRLWFMGKVFNKLFFWKLYASNLVELDKKFEKMNECILKHNINFKDKIVLELGPGNSYVNAFNFLLHGAQKVILIDKFPRQIKTKRQQKYFLDEIEYIKKKYKKSDLFFLNPDNKIKTEYILFVNNDLLGSTVETEIDFIYSISVFEHVKDISENIKKLAKILVSGGCMYHHIDMRDHYNFNEPFLFYKYSDKAWNKYFTNEGVSYTNRWRYDDYLKAFADNKLFLLDEHIINYPVGKNKINQIFFKKNLDCGIANVLLKK